MEIDREFLAWLAGFWEGEGDILVRPYSQKNRYDKPHMCLHCQFSVSQTRRKPLEYIQSKLGGNIVTTWDQNPKHNPCFRWHPSGGRKAVLTTLKTILPFLKFRETEVKNAIAKIEGWRPNYRRWTNEEIELLFKKYDLSNKELSKILNRSSGAIQHIRQELGIRRRKSEIAIAEAYRAWEERREEWFK